MRSASLRVLSSFEPTQLACSYVRLPGIRVSSSSLPLRPIVRKYICAGFSNCSTAKHVVVSVEFSASRRVPIRPNSDHRLNSEILAWKYEFILSEETTMPVNSTKLPAPSSAQARMSTPRRGLRSKGPSEDEILGLVTSVTRPAASSDADAQFFTDDAKNAASTTAGAKSATQGGTSAQSQNATAPAESSEVAQVLQSHPELRDAVEAAQQFREIFPTPSAAQDAKTQLDELDSMFFSGAPADHAALAARIHELSPEAFHGLAGAMNAHAANVAATKASWPGASAGANVVKQGEVEPAGVLVAPHTETQSAGGTNASSARSGNAGKPDALSDAPPIVNAERSTSATPSITQTADPRRTAQLAFFHSTNAAAVQKLVAAIESQVNHLLPESISSGAKTRIVGEIYRDLDSTLRGNQQLGKQLRNAFAVAAGDAANPQADTRAHQQAIVTLVTGRARQALPSIAKRVINEWTHSVVSANRERLARHESAAKRVDIAGAGASDGVNRKPVSPREVDYKRLSDSDILNL